MQTTLKNSSRSFSKSVDMLKVKTPEESEKLNADPDPVQQALGLINNG